MSDARRDQAAATRPAASEFFDGAVRQALADDARHVEVALGPVDMLQLRDDAPATGGRPPDGLLPGRILVHAATGDADRGDGGGDVVGELLLRTVDGRVDVRGSTWWSDAAPESLPSPGELSVVPPVPNA